MDLHTYAVSKKFTEREVERIVNRETDTDAMSRQAAVNADGVDKVNLKARLDDDYGKLTTQLAQIAPLSNLLKKQPSDIDDTERLQRAIDYCYTNKIPLVLNGGTFTIRSLTFKPGVSIYGNGVIFKKPNLKVAPYNMTDEQIKWLRMLTVDINALERSRQSVIDGITFDGSCWDLWTTPSYVYEQASSLYLGVVQDVGNPNSKFKVKVNNCHFINSVSDGIHAGMNTNITITNCSSYDCFRGGLTVTGANSLITVNGLTCTGDLMNDGIDFEVDSGSKIEVNMNNVLLFNAELDIQVPSNSIANINNLIMDGAKGATTLGVNPNGIFNMSNSVIVSVSTMTTNTSRFFWLGEYNFRNCTFIGTSAAVFLWATPYTSDTSAYKVTARFDNCEFKGTNTTGEVLGISVTSTSALCEVYVNNSLFHSSLNRGVLSYGDILDIRNCVFECGGVLSTMDCYYSGNTNRELIFYDNTVRGSKAVSLLVNMRGYKTSLKMKNQISSQHYLHTVATGGQLWWLCTTDQERTDSCRYVSENVVHFKDADAPSGTPLLGDTAITRDGKKYKTLLNGTTVQWVLESA